MNAHNLAERARRTEKTLARFRHRAFDWNGASCIHLARAQAVAMGHKVPKLGTIRSAIGARRALKDQGHERVEDLLDSLFPRVPPLGMLIGDLCAVPGVEGFPALFIGDGHGNLLGWHEEGGDKMAVVKYALLDVTAAWRL